MIVGRICGWVLLLSGIGLLVRYYTVSAEWGRVVPNTMAEMAHGADSWVLQIVEGSFVTKLTAMMVSGWTGALLILFGMVLVWGCRRPRLDR